MSRGQRLGFLGIAAVIAVLAIVLLSDSGSDEEPARTAAENPTATPDLTPDGAEEATPEEIETPEPTPTPEPKPPLLTAGKETKLSAKEGETVRFRVRHDTVEHVHVHGYDIFRDLQPGKTETVSFKADITGIFEIELEDSGVLLAELKVEP